MKGKNFESSEQLDGSSESEIPNLQVQLPDQEKEVKIMAGK